MKIPPTHAGGATQRNQQPVGLTMTKVHATMTDSFALAQSHAAAVSAKAPAILAPQTRRVMKVPKSATM
jgi:hypothetical protein